jgi:hypothetical protein
MADVYRCIKCGQVIELRRISLDFQSWGHAINPRHDKHPATPSRMARAKIDAEHKAWERVRQVAAGERAPGELVEEWGK